MKILLFILLFLSNSKVYAQSGVPDSTFGTNGVGAISFVKGHGSFVAIQTDGKIVTSGGSNNYHCGVARYKTDGTLDSTFGSNGLTVLAIGSGDNENDGGLVIQPDGKILVGGICGYNSLSLQLIRYSANGTLDNSFNGTGYVITAIGQLADVASALALQPDGKILQSASSINAIDSGHYISIARFNADGSLDNSFGLAGISKTFIGNTSTHSYPIGIVVQPDGKILVGCYTYGSTFPSEFSLVRYNSNGTLDNNFGQGGITTTFFSAEDNDQAYGIALQADSKILMTGQSIIGPNLNSDYRVSTARYNIDGTLDNSFGQNGKVLTNINGTVFSIALQKDDKIVVAGGGSLDSSEGGFLLVRYKANGLPDSTFGKNGIAVAGIDTSSEYANSVAIQQDGKIVVTGYSDKIGMVVARFLSGLNTGVLNFTIKNNPVLIYPNPIYKTAELQYNLTQTESITLTLYNMQGKLVQTFFTGQSRQQGEHKEPLHFANLAAGNYILSISNGNSTQGVKIVKE